MRERIKRRTEGLSVDGRDESVVDGRKDSFEEAKLAKGGEEEYAEKKEMRLTGFEPGIRPSIRRTLDRSDSRVRFDMKSPKSDFLTRSMLYCTIYIPAQGREIMLHLPSFFLYGVPRAGRPEVRSIKRNEVNEA